MVPGSNWERTTEERNVCLALEKVAAQVGVQNIGSGTSLLYTAVNGHSIDSLHDAVAIAYLMHKTPYVFPLIGGRKLEQLQHNIQALDISLSKEQIAFLDAASPFNPGFPYAMFVSLLSDRRCIGKGRCTECNFMCQGDGSSYNFLAQSSGQFDKWPQAEPIRPDTKTQS